MYRSVESHLKQKKGLSRDCTNSANRCGQRVNFRTGSTWIDKKHSKNSKPPRAAKITKKALKQSSKSKHSHNSQEQDGGSVEPNFQSPIPEAVPILGSPFSNKENNKAKEVKTGTSEELRINGANLHDAATKQAGFNSYARNTYRVPPPGSSYGYSAFPGYDAAIPNFYMIHPSMMESFHMTEPCGLVGASEGNGANKIRMQFKDFCERRRCRMHSKAATHVEIAYLIFNGENTRGFDVKLRDNA